MAFVAVAALIAAALGGALPATAASSGTASSGTTTSGAGQKVTFTVGILHDVDSMNPFTGLVAEAYEMYQIMYDSLDSTSPKDFSPVAALASQQKVSDDGKTWTYTIRSGVKWSDGVPLTAKDVAYTFNRILKGSYEKTNWGGYLTNVTSVTAPDDSTVVITTKVPSPGMTHIPIPVLPEHVWSKVSEKDVKTYKNEDGVVGSGPFVLAERKVGQFIRFTANKQYWGGAPKIDELVFRVYRNADSLAQALKKGEVDFADNLDASVWDSLKDTPGITAWSGKYGGFDELAFNTGAALDDGTPIGDGHPALKDKVVRQAISYAIDRDTVVKRVLNGAGSVGTTIIPPIYATQHLDPAAPYGFDVAKANQMLDAAGYKKGPDGIRTMPDGSRPLKFRLVARQESSASQQSVRLIQAWLKDIGIATQVKVVAEDNLSELIGQGKFDMFEWGWVVEPDPDYQLSTFTCANRSYKDGGEVYANLSDSFYCNPAYDALYAKQSGQIDPAARVETVKKMQQILYDDAPYAVLYYYDDLQAYSTKFTGFVPQPSDHGIVLFQYGTWSYLNIHLAADDTAKGAQKAADTSGSSTPLLVGGVLVVLLALGFGGVLARRRRADDADVE
jgi:peptide/nickel transport system substrate-binding protein